MATLPFQIPPGSDFYEQYLKIKDRRTSKIVPFKLNKVQKRFRQIVARHRKENGDKVRLIVLKARREGISTIVEAMLFRQVLMVPNFSALVVAHNQQSTEEIFRMYRLFRDECMFKHEEKANNRREIEYAPPHRSSARIITVGSEDIGKGFGPQGLHLSEVASWPVAYAAGAFSSIANAVFDGPGTFIVLESTADGVGGLFYDHWQATYQSGLGTIAPNGYEAVFFSWLEDEDYVLDVPLDAHRWESISPEWLEDEPRLRSLGASDKQLAWRRQAIGGKCNGDPQYFLQYYPAVPEDAFISSGRPFFLPSTVTAGIKRCEDRDKATPPRRFRVMANGDWVPDIRGPLKVWEEPNRQKDYLITADVARCDEEEGRRLGDYSTFGVWDREERREIAVWHGRLQPDLFAEQLFHVGQRYATAEICPEANNYGYIVAMTLLQMNYPNVARRRVTDKVTTATLFPASGFAEAGFWTTPKSRPLMLTDMEVMLRRGDMEVLEVEAWKEMSTFKYGSDGKPQSQRGCYDDRVMRIALAAAIMKDDPWAERRRQRKDAPKVGTFDWFAMLREARRKAAGVGEGITL